MLRNMSFNLYLEDLFKQSTPIQMKEDYFLGDEDFVDIFGGHHKIGLYLGVILMHFRVFT